MDWNFVHRTLRPIRSKLVAFTKQESLEYQETDECRRIGRAIPSAAMNGSILDESLIENIGVSSWSGTGKTARNWKKKQWDELAALGKRYPDLSLPVRRNTLYLKASMDDALIKIINFVEEKKQSKSSCIKRDVFPSLTQLCAFKVGEMMESQYIDIEDQEHIYSIIPEHYRRWLLIQHLANLALIHVNYTHIFHEMVDIFTSNGLYHQGFQLILRIIDMMPANYNNLIFYYSVCKSMKKSREFLQHVISVQNHETIQNSAIEKFGSGIPFNEDRIVFTGGILKKLIFFRQLFPALVKKPRSKTRNLRWKFKKVILSVYLSSILSSKYGFKYIHGLYLFTYSPLFIHDKELRIAIILAGLLVCSANSEYPGCAEMMEKFLKIFLEIDFKPKKDHVDYYCGNCCSNDQLFKTQQLIQLVQAPISDDEGTSPTYIDNLEYYENDEVLRPNELSNIENHTPNEEIFSGELDLQDQTPKRRLLELGTLSDTPRAKSMRAFLSTPIGKHDESFILKSRDKS